jgi:diaminopimelate epimerase
MLVGEDSMGFPHMVVDIEEPQTWVLIEHVDEYGPWTQSTHRQHAMFQVCLDQKVKDEEHLGE